jgi:dTDP-4-dehydrorhamnose reductase
MTSRPILLLGANGQIGFELRRSLTPLGTVVAWDRADLDLADEPTLRRRLREISPSILVNAAAYTNVDQAESDEAAAMIVNGSAPGWLGEEAARAKIPLIHYSTDYVFDGRAKHPYTEEVAFLLLRTSWIYSLRGRNFLLTILRLAEQPEELRVVADQIGCPTSAEAVADATATILQRCWRAGSSDPLSGQAGLYHLAARGETSWHGFAEAIIAETSMGKPRRAVHAIPTSEFPRPAKRPAYSVLDSSKAVRVFGAAMPEWRGQLRRCLSPLLGKGGIRPGL